MDDDMIMRKKPETIELEFQNGGEAARVKNQVLTDLQNSGWEAAVRSEIKKYLSNADDNVTAQDVFEAVKDSARRDVPTDIKKRLYDEILDFVKNANSK